MVARPRKTLDKTESRPSGRLSAVEEPKVRNGKSGWRLEANKRNRSELSQGAFGWIGEVGGVVKGFERPAVRGEAEAGEGGVVEGSGELEVAGRGSVEDGSGRDADGGGGSDDGETLEIGRRVFEGLLDAGGELLPRFGLGGEAAADPGSDYGNVGWGPLAVDGVRWVLLVRERFSVV